MGYYMGFNNKGTPGLKWGGTVWDWGDQLKTVKVKDPNPEELAGANADFNNFGMSMLSRR
jgi:hypothetical protein